MHAIKVIEPKWVFDVRIRTIQETDLDPIWEIFREVVKTGDTYVFEPNISKVVALKNWVGEKFFTYVAEIDGEVLGTYIVKQNQQGLGSHIANASYMVHPTAHGKGIGRAMAEHSIQEAKKLSFKAIQFNLVVATNLSAIKLWKKMGFEIIGTIPGAFKNMNQEFVDAHIMYLKL